MCDRVPPEVFEARERRKCAEKTRFSREIMARTQGWSVLAQRGSDMKLYPYQCPWCRSWHLSSKFKPGVKPVTAKSSGAM